MRRIVCRLVTVLAAAAMGTAVAAGPAAAAPVRVPTGMDQPPWPYKDCLAAAKQHKESPAYAKWHCDELVKKGWIKKPGT
ncbi:MULTISPECIES: hypothetical protein [Streptomyces]|uniref:Uncharacterized protein n=1 Tax=Streptomyces luteosporeus TaxID=173856 RepID=A0ABP6GMD3_9ACTN